MARITQGCFSLLPDLTDEQILEISDYLNSGVHIESYCEMILNDIVNNREIEE